MIGIGNFIQKHFIGGYELYTKKNLRATKKSFIEVEDIEELAPEPLNEEIAATIVDQDNGILFDVKLKELQAGELPTEHDLKKASIFELKGEDGTIKKFLISTAVAKLLKEQTKIEGDLYMMDLDESDEFDAHVASIAGCYKPSTYLSLLTGEKSYAVAAGKENLEDTVSQAGTGSKRTAIAKFIDPLAELMKPGIEQYSDNFDKTALKGALSKSRVMGAFLIASFLVMGAGIFLTFGGVPVLGIGIIATIPLYIALPVAIGPFGLALIINIFSRPYTAEIDEYGYIVKNLTKLHKFYNFIANPANKAVLIYIFASVLIALVTMPFFGPLLVFGAASISVLLIILSRVANAYKHRSITGILLFISVTPWLMGAVRYLITGGILLKPAAAGVAWCYERFTNWSFSGEHLEWYQKFGVAISYFIVTFIVGLISGVLGIFNIKIPLARVNFDKAKHGKDIRDICHWVAVHIAANVGRLLVLSLVVSVVVMTLAYTSGIASLISGIGFISSIPVVGPIISGLFISGPMSFFLSSTASVVAVVLGGTGFSIFLAYPMIREVWTLFKELIRLKLAMGLSGVALSVALLFFVSNVVSIPMLSFFVLYVLVAVWRRYKKHNTVNKKIKMSELSINKTNSSKSSDNEPEEPDFESNDKEENRSRSEIFKKRKESFEESERGSFIKGAQYPVREYVSKIEEGSEEIEEENESFIKPNRARLGEYLSKIEGSEEAEASTILKEPENLSAIQAVINQVKFAEDGDIEEPVLPKKERKQWFNSSIIAEENIRGMSSIISVNNSKTKEERKKQKTKKRKEKKKLLGKIPSEIPSNEGLFTLNNIESDSADYESEDL